MWIETMDQFRDDVLPSEELQIKQWLIIEVLQNRSMKERKKHIDELERSEQDLEKLYKVPLDSRDINRINNLETRIAFLRNSIGSYTSEHNKLSADSQRIIKDLKATRDQRFKQIESSKETWTQQLRQLEDEDKRKKAGEEMEIMRLAKEKSKEQLGEYHTYVDGTVDMPLLTPETIKRRREQDSKV